MIIFFSFILFFCVAFLGYMWYKAFRDHIDYKTVHLNLHLDQPVKVFFISDIHARKIKQGTINQVKETIDMVIIGGDLLEKGVKLHQVKENLSILKTFQAPIYFVWGNNDYEMNQHKLNQFLTENGVYVLKDSIANSNHDTTAISLIGLDYYKDYEQCKTTVESTLCKADGDIKFLITHDPSIFFNFTKHQIDQIDFVLSGHTHGGQIRIFGYGPYTKGGLKSHVNTPVMVSEGYGYTKLPLRLGTNAECHVITIK